MTANANTTSLDTLRSTLSVETDGQSVCKGGCGTTDETRDVVSLFSIIPETAEEVLEKAMQREEELRRSPILRALYEHFESKRGLK